MAEASAHGLSKRGWSNIQVIMPKIKSTMEQRSIEHNTDIDLNTSENRLIRSELISFCKESIQENLVSRHFSYPQGLSGDPDLLDAHAKFFNRYFYPNVPVLPSHLSTGPGATACIDALLYNICEPGDGVLVLTPYWSGFDFTMGARSSVTPVPVPLPSLHSGFSVEQLRPALDQSYWLAKRPIKALMITNPHNPLGLCYPRDVLEMFLVFCKDCGIHFISDEVYALSVFSGPDRLNPQPFVSVLSLDLDRIGADRGRVHTVWSTSKDFGLSGLRMGCVVTQHNHELIVGLALATSTQLSALTAIIVTKLLASPDLTSLLSLNSRRLSAAYTSLTAFFRVNEIPYLPCNAGLYVWARLAPRAETWDDEADMVARLKEAGVLLAGGRAFHGPETEKGWMRVGFAVEEVDLCEAIKRMQRVIDSGLTRPDLPMTPPM